MEDDKPGLRERLSGSPRLIAVIGMLAWFALLWFMLRDVM